MVILVVHTFQVHLDALDEEVSRCLDVVDQYEVVLPSVVYSFPLVALLVLSIMEGHLVVTYLQMEASVNIHSFTTEDDYLHFVGSNYFDSKITFSFMHICS